MSLTDDDLVSSFTDSEIFTGSLPESGFGATLGAPAAGAPDSESSRRDNGRIRVGRLLILGCVGDAKNISNNIYLLITRKGRQTGLGFTMALYPLLIIRSDGASPTNPSPLSVESHRSAARWGLHAFRFLRTSGWRNLFLQTKLEQVPNCPPHRLPSPPHTH